MARAKDVKAKEKKQKIILGGLGVVLLIVLAIELPGMLSSGGSTSAATTTTGATTTTAPSGTSPVPAANVASSGTAVASSEVVFSASVAKLSSLGFFKPKDPFDSHGVGATPAVDPASASAAAAATSPPAPAAIAKAAAKVAVAAGATTSSGPVFGTIQGAPSQSGSSPSQSGTSIPSAKIRFNGHPLTVALGASFPKSNPYFRLAGVTPDGVMISVLKGSLADGSASIELLKNTPLTLVNTASGSRFRIELLSASKKT